MRLFHRRRIRLYERDPYAEEMLLPDHRAAAVREVRATDYRSLCLVGAAEAMIAAALAWLGLVR